MFIYLDGIFLLIIILFQFIKLHYFWVCILIFFKKAYTMNEWSHYAIIFDPTPRIYRDGKELIRETSTEPF